MVIDYPWEVMGLNLGKKSRKQLKVVASLPSPKVEKNFTKGRSIGHDGALK